MKVQREAKLERVPGSKGAGGVPPVRRLRPGYSGSIAIQMAIASVADGQGQERERGSQLLVPLAKDHQRTGHDQRLERVDPDDRLRGEPTLDAEEGEVETERKDVGQPRASRSRECPGQRAPRPKIITLNVCTRMRTSKSQVMCLM